MHRPLTRGSLSRAMVAHVVDVHTVREVLDTQAIGQRTQLGEEFGLAVVAAVGVVGTEGGVEHLLGVDHVEARAYARRQVFGRLYLGRRDRFRERRARPAHHGRP